MRLKKVTLLLIVTMVVSFSTRTLGTVFPQIFKNILIVKATILINAIFILSHLAFWILFYREYITEKKPALKTICSYVIIGAVAVAAIYLKKLPFVFGVDPQLPRFLLNPYVNALVPLISALINLAFFMSFKSSLTPDEVPDLSTPIVSMLVGNGLFICLHVIVLFNFVLIGSFKWLEHMPRGMALGTVPVILLAVGCMLFFYYRFYRYLNATGNREKITAEQG